MADDRGKGPGHSIDLSVATQARAISADFEALSRHWLGQNDSIVLLDHLEGTRLQK